MADLAAPRSTAPTAPSARIAGSGDPLRGALLDSRQRWRDLVTITADLAFETDEGGCFVFVTPDPALGWSAARLIGQPARTLLADGAADCFDLFAVDALVRRRRVWLRRGDGGLACMAFAAAPLLDPPAASWGRAGWASI
jgi:hypothetical protein